MRKILALIVVSILLISCKSNSETLTFNLEAGKSYRQVTNNKSVVVQEMNGQQMKIEMAMQATVAYLVKAVNETSYDIELQYESTTMTMTMPNGALTFSSEKEAEANDFVSPMLKAIKGKAFNIKMDKLGKVLEITGVDALWEDMTEVLTNLPEAQAEQLKKQIIDSFGGEALKGNLEMATAIYPENPVKKGDKWNTQTELATIMKAKVSTDYELVDISGEYATIKGVSTIEPEGEPEFKEQNGMLMKFDLRGTMQSEIKVDKATGWIIEAKISQEMKGNTALKGEGIPEGLLIPMTVNNEMLITN